MKIPGQYKRSMGKWDTFLPDLLPPKIEISEGNEKLSEKATHLLGQVNMCRTLLPNAELLIYSSLQREALASSTIEGTIATPAELVLFQTSQKTDREPVREVANYSIALQAGREHIKSKPLTLNLMLDLHSILMTGVRGDNAAGQFKRTQNFIGGYGADAAFIPSAPEDVPGLMSNLESYWNQEQRYSKVIQTAIAHYQFETIHPFNDGNGRVGRLVILLHIISLGLLNDPLIYPSVYFEKKRSQYYDALQSVRDKGAWNAYLSYYLHGIINQCEETIMFTNTCTQMQDGIRKQINGVKRHASVERVLNEFFKLPIRTIGDLAIATKMTTMTVGSAIELLTDLDLVSEITGKEKGRVFACLPLYDLIFK